MAISVSFEAPFAWAIDRWMGTETNPSMTNSVTMAVFIGVVSWNDAASSPARLPGT